MTRYKITLQKAVAFYIPTTNILRGHEHTPIYSNIKTISWNKPNQRGDRLLQQKSTYFQVKLRKTLENGKTLVFMNQ